MALTIQPHQNDDVPVLCELFNQQAHDIDHIARLDTPRFNALVVAKPYFDPQGLLVARDGGETIGWIHACVAAGSEPYHDPANAVARIRMLCFEPGRLDVGAALLHAAHAYLRQRGCMKIEAFHARHGYPFYRGLWMGGEPMAPVTLPHVLIALTTAGYRLTQQSVFMTCRMTDPPTRQRRVPELQIDDQPTTMAHEPMRASWIGFEPHSAAAAIEGRHVGAIHWVLVPHLADKLGAPCVNIWGLGVESAYRGRGFANELIHHVLRQGYDRGARHASVGTQVWNHPAHATYARAGFHPHTLLHALDIELEQNP